MFFTLGVILMIVVAAQASESFSNKQCYINHFIRLSQVFKQ